MTLHDYTCPVCSEKFSRDLVRYLSHIKQEISVKIRENYPEWDDKQGMCQDCHSYWGSWFDRIK